MSRPHQRNQKLSALRSTPIVPGTPLHRLLQLIAKEIAGELANRGVKPNAKYLRTR
jgi:hypothetical protein